MMPILSMRRHCARHFRSVPRDVLLLTIGVVITLTLVVRQYNGRFDRDLDDQVQNPLREISLHPEDDEHTPADDSHHRAPEKHIPEVVVKRSMNDLVNIDPRIRRIGDHLSDICRENQQEVLNIRRLNSRHFQDALRPVNTTTRRLRTDLLFL